MHTHWHSPALLNGMEEIHSLSRVPSAPSAAKAGYNVANCELSSSEFCYLKKFKGIMKESSDEGKLEAEHFLCAQLYKVH